MIAVVAFVAAAQPTRAQNQAPPTQPPGLSPCPLPAPSPAPLPDGNQPPSTSHGFHCVTVIFDYDFSKTPACSMTVTKGCVQQFIAFDISAGTKHPPILFPIPLPPNPVGAVHGITKTGPPTDFESGKHLIAVSAMTPDGHHSRRSLCTTWITIP
ncbi:MAG: hypothetical protein WB559_10610 [Candidatus Acidiferrales bacterium]